MYRATIDYDFESIMPDHIKEAARKSKILKRQIR